MALDIEEIYPLASSEVVDPNSPGMGAPGVAFRKPPFSGCEPLVAPAPSSTLPPVGDLLPLQDILNASSEAMEKVESYHMEIAQYITPEGEDNEEKTSMTMINDSQSPDRLRLFISHSDSIGLFEFQVVSIGDVIYTAYPDSAEWEIDEVSDESIDLLDFTDDAFMTNIKEPSVAGLEVLNDVKVYRITGTVTAASLGSTRLLGAGSNDMAVTGEFKIIYWIGVDDFLVRRFVAEGDLELEEEEEEEKVGPFMSVEISDFGEVRVEAPMTGLPLDTSARWGSYSQKSKR